MRCSTGGAGGSRTDVGRRGRACRQRRARRLPAARRETIPGGRAAGGSLLRSSKRSTLSARCLTAQDCSMGRAGSCVHKCNHASMPAADPPSRCIPAEVVATPCWNRAHASLAHPRAIAACRRSTLWRGCAYWRLRFWRSQGLSRALRPWRNERRPRSKSPVHYSLIRRSREFRRLPPTGDGSSCFPGTRLRIFFRSNRSS